MVTRYTLHLFLTFFILSTLTLVIAQDEERVGKSRSCNRVIIVIDTSGSMDNGKLQAATKAALSVAIQPTDDLEIGVITFQSEAEWLTHDTKNGSSKWFKLPSVHVLAALKKKLLALTSDGSTYPETALIKAYATPTQAIVMITDGDFYLSPNIVSNVKRYRKALADRNIFVPPLIIMAIQSTKNDLAKLQHLANETDSQLWSPTEEPENR